MEGCTLNTRNGEKKLDPDVALFVKRQQDELISLRRERNDLKMRVLYLECQKNRGFLARLFSN